MDDSSAGGSSAPTVSFVIPVRNSAARLDACLKSIRRNKYESGRTQVIVVDHGSDDDSVQVAQRHGATVMSRRGGGVSDLRNLGASAATGDVLAFVDADHELDEGWLRAVASCM